MYDQANFDNNIWSEKCTVLQILDTQIAMTMKTGLGVRQGHWKYHPSIQRVRLPIDVLE